MLDNQPLLFCRTAPAEPGEGPLAHAPTFTWTAEAKRFLRLLSAGSTGVDMRLVDGAEPYGLTLTAGGGIPDALAATVSGSAAELRRLAERHPFAAFRDLLGDGVTTDGIRVLFAILRDELVAQTADPRSALVPPITEAPAATSDFPLHADLFGADILFNVFCDVPDDGTGMATFLGVDDMRRALADSGAPADVAAAAVALVARDTGPRDGFDDLMDLLYHPGRPHSAAFRRLVDTRCTRLRPAPGTGYLLDDKRYLHGRDRSSGNVSPDRLVRLVFASQPLPQWDGAWPGGGPMLRSASIGHPAVDELPRKAGPLPRKALVSGPTVRATEWRKAKALVGVR